MQAAHIFDLMIGIHDHIWQVESHWRKKFSSVSTNSNESLVMYLFIILDISHLHEQFFIKFPKWSYYNCNWPSV